MRYNVLYSINLEAPAMVGFAFLYICICECPSVQNNRQEKKKKYKDNPLKKNEKGVNSMGNAQIFQNILANFS